MCEADTATLTATGAVTYLWNNGNTSNTMKVSPVVTTTYSLVGTDGNGCSASDAVVVNVIARPIADAGENQTICEGSTVSLKATGGSTYTWSGLVYGSNRSVNPVVTTTYEVSVYNASGCSASDNVIVTVNTIPVIDAGANQTMCFGNSVNLTATGGGTYTWSYNSMTSATINVSPILTTTYSLTVNKDNCSATDDVVVTVNALPVANAGADVSICLGDGTQLQYTGTIADSVKWNNNVIGISQWVNPVLTTTYTATAYSNGCSASDAVVVTVTPSVVANAGVDVTICSGNSTTLTAQFVSGASYNWSKGESTRSITVTPMATTTYALEVRIGSCYSKDTVVVTVNPKPTVNAGLDINICEAGSDTLIATGANSYVWSEGTQNDTVIVNPVSTTTYKVTGTDVNGCSATDDVIVNVKSLPIANAGDNKTICFGGSTLLTASGGTSYNWDIPATGSNVTVNPVVTTTYTVTVANASGCSASDNVIVFVTPIPGVSAGLDKTICTGDNVTLTAVGGDSYLWSNGFGSASITVSPNDTTTYTVTVAKDNCSATDDVVVIVNPLPVVNAGEDKILCRGDSVWLIATGAATYVWSQGTSNDSLHVSPFTITTYTVTGTLNTCNNTDNVVVTIVDIPTANAGIDQGICSGQSATLVATGGGTYSWSNNSTSASNTVYPDTITTYIVTVTLNGCTATDEVKVSVGTIPIPDAGSDTAICYGNSVQLTATGGGTYTWSNGGTTPTISVQPTVNTNYVVTVNINGCTASDAVNVTVNSLPYINAGDNKTICSGASVQLSANATAGSTFFWEDSTNTSTRIVSPVGNTTYIVTANLNGCTTSDDVTVTVNPIPNANAGLDDTICKNEPSFLTASGGTSYLWDIGPTTNTIEVSPPVTRKYVVTVTKDNCTNTDEVTVVVNQLPNVFAGNDVSVCRGDSATLIVRNALTYLWSNIEPNDTMKVLTLATTTYTVTGWDANGCSASDDVVVVVRSMPLADFSFGNICVNTSTQFMDQSVIVAGYPISSWTWDFGGGDFAYVKNPNYTYSTSGAKAVKLSIEDVVGCRSEITYNVQVYDNPVADFKFDTVCYGTPTVFHDLSTLGGGSSIVERKWSFGDATSSDENTPSHVYQNIIAYNVTLEVKDNFGCKSNVIKPITINPLPVANAGQDQTICTGSCGTLIATGGVLYSWSGAPANDTVSVCPSVTTSYSVTVTNIYGCTATDGVNVTVVEANLANAGSDHTICVGGTATLDASASGSVHQYSWSISSTPDSIFATNVITQVSPTVTTIYTVTTNKAGCTSSDNVAVIVNPLPIVNAGVDTNICKGSTIKLIATGADSYTWSTGLVGSTIEVTPSVNTAYMVTGRTNAGCTATDDVTVFVTPLQANAGSDKTICYGDNVTLCINDNNSNANGWAWSNGEVTPCITVNPIVSTTYFVTISNALGCTTSDNVAVIVNPAPTVDAGNNQTICAGSNVSLTASGSSGVVYTWSTGPSLTATITETPNAQTTYIVTARNTATGCTASDNVIVFVTPIPNANAGPDRTTCNGSSAVLQATGGGTYVWSNGAGTGSTVSVNPPVTTNYTVTVTKDGCTATDDVLVTFSNPPVVSASAPKTICSGTSTIISATTGMDTYIWNTEPPSSDGIVVVTPSSTTIYQVTVSKYGCTNSAYTIVTVQKPTVEAGINRKICLGSCTDLIATSPTAVSYQWDNGNNGPTMQVCPSVQTIYTVTATDNKGCMATDFVIVEVENLNPDAGPLQKICQGKSANLVGTAVSSAGGLHYTWSNGPGTAQNTVSPIVTTVYTLTVSDANFCTATDDVIIEVLEIPVPDAGSNRTVCKNTDVVLTGTATGGLLPHSFKWSEGSAGSLQTVKVTENKAYQLIVTDANGCSNSDDVIIGVYDLPLANAGANQTICSNTSTTLNATANSSGSTSTGPYSFAWDHNLSPVATPGTPLLVTNTQYKLTVTDVNGCTASNNVTITINELPNADAGEDKTICKGKPVTLTATGGGTYKWSCDNSPASTITISPESNTQVSVTVTKDGCSAIDVVNIAVNNSPVVNASADKTSACKNTEVVLDVTATGGSAPYTYNWNIEGNVKVGKTQPVTIIATTPYNVTVIDANGCESTSSIVITANELPVVSAGSNQTICKGATVTLTPTGGVTYSWSNGVTQAQNIVKPDVTTIYIVTGTNANGCTASNSVTITVNALPNVDAGIDKTICAGGEATLEATGASTYSWQSGPSNPTYKVTPNVSTVYVVTGTDGNSCSASDNVTVHVNQLPTANAGADESICLNDEIILDGDANGGAPSYNYEWSGVLGKSRTVKPLSSMVYTLKVIDAKGCVATDDKVVTVNPLPNVSAGANQTMCEGGSVTLSATGASTYAWNPSGGVVSPVVTTIYTVTGTDAKGCSASNSVIVTVNPKPLADAGIDKTICAGGEVTLTANGGDTYQWLDNSPGQSIKVTPNITTIYTVVVTGANGCSASDDVKVTVNPLPIADAGADKSICSGTSTSLNGGASSGQSPYTFNWDNNLPLGQNPTTLVLVSNTQYKLTVTDVNGCQATDVVNIFINPLPIANAGNNTTICFGKSLLLQASGGVSYQWSNNINSSQNNVSPIINTNYIVTVTDGNGCTASASVNIDVSPLPLVNAGSDKTICKGGEAILIATNANSYLWSNTDPTSNTKVTPNVTTVYTVTGTGPNGCTASDDVTVFVNALPSISINAGQNQTVCDAGSSVTLTATGGSTYEWSENNATTSSIVVIPPTTTTYKVTGTDVSGCSNTASVIVVLSSRPSVDAGNSKTICSGETVVLQAIGTPNSTYLWNPGGDITSSISVKPAITTIYEVTISKDGCTASDNVSITVNEMPIASAGPDVTICEGTCTKLHATGGTSYTWTGGTIDANMDVCPIVTTTYTVTAQIKTCTNIDEVIVFVTPAPSLAVTTDKTICAGESVPLNASGANTYSWYDKVVYQNTNSNITVSPVSTTTYYVEGVKNGCSSTAVVIITVNPIPSISAGPDKTLCFGTGSVSIVGSGADNYLWNPGLLTGSSIEVAPTSTQKYIVTGTSKGCTATDEMFVNVLPLPDAGISATKNVICEGESVTITASGGGSYKWSAGGQTTTSITEYPTSTQSYEVTVTKDGCEKTAKTIINVNLKPTLNAGADLTVCKGGSATINVSTNGSLVWSDTKTSTTRTENPSVTTTYTMTSTLNGCQATDDVIVNVLPIPNAYAGEDVTICDGITAQLKVVGGSSWKWSYNNSQAQIVNVTPSVTTTYYVTVDANGCTNDDAVVVFVNQIPVADGGPDQTVCKGTTVDLTAKSCPSCTYTWAGGIIGSSIYSVTPNITSTYYLTVTANGCSSSASVIINVLSVPTASAGADVTICAGACTKLEATGGNTYSWSTGSTANFIDACPAITQTYKVVVKAANGCTALDDVVVTVNNIVANAGSDKTVCKGNSVILDGSPSGADTYLWTPTSENKKSITVSPLVTTIYKLEISKDGCTASDDVFVTVYAPSANAGEDQSICAGEEITLYAPPGGSSYKWGPKGETTGSISVKPEITTNYSVTVTDELGCTASDNVIVNVNPLPSINAGEDKTICRGECINLIVNGATTNKWNTGSTDPNILVCPIVNTTYIVTGYSAAKCEASDEVVVTVVEKPVANAGGNKTICEGEEVTLYPSGNGIITWDDGTKGSRTVSPKVTTTYVVSVENLGCVSTAMAVVKVNPLPMVSAGNDQTICSGNKVALNATGALSYKWSGPFIENSEVASTNASPTSNSGYSVTGTDINGCSANDAMLVTISPIPNAEINPKNSIICANTCVELVASGGVKYKWSNKGEVVDAITVCPSQSATYKVTVTDAIGCTATDEAIINTTPSPIVDAGSNVTICAGSFTNLNATSPNGSGIWTWRNNITGELNSGQNILVSPITTTTYTVTLNNNGCTASDNVVVFVNPLPVPGLNSKIESICMGEDITICAADGGTYNWTDSYSNYSGACINVSPTKNTTYKVTVTTDAGCSKSDNLIVVVNPIPVAIANIYGDPIICAGESTILVPSGGGTYLWYPAVPGPNFTVTPNVTTTYRLTVTKNGCTATDDVQVTVVPLPNIKATASPENICNGAQSILVASGSPDDKYLWSNSPIEAINVVKPNITTTYKVTGWDGACSNSASVVVNVTTPVANAGLDRTICAGETITLDASSSGGVSYVWNTYPYNVPLVAVSPEYTSVYAVSVTYADGCTASDAVTVVVYQLPNVSAGSNIDLCRGDSVKLTGSGAINYEWSVPPPATGKYKWVGPVSTTTYTVTGESNGCTNTASVTVTVNDIPTITITVVGNDTLCAGEKVTLVANGADQYIWNAPADNSVQYSVTVDPVSTTTFVVTGTSLKGCKASKSQVIVVNPVPVADAGPDKSICLGFNVNIEAKGGVDYKWMNSGGVNMGATSIINVGPMVNTTYTVTAYANGCSSQDEMVVTVNFASVDAGADKMICSGGEVVLAATGSSTYSWDTKETTSSIKVAPTSSKIYTVTGYDKGCSATDEVVVTITPMPIADGGFDRSICNGENTILHGNGGALYRWSGGETDTTIQSVVVSPTTTTKYCLTVIAPGCPPIPPVCVTVTVNPLPIVKATTEKPICRGYEAEMCVTESSTAIDYIWSDGVIVVGSGECIKVQPISTTNYFITGTDEKGCKSTDLVQVVVNPLPVATTGGNKTICQGTSATLIANEAMNKYSWATNAAGTDDVETSRLIIVSPDITTTYYLTITNENGCTGSNYAIVNVLDLPAADFTAPSVWISDVTSFSDLSSSSNGNGNIEEWYWNFGDVSTSDLSFPTHKYKEPGIYNVMLVVTDSKGCIDTVYKNVIVNDSIRAFFTFSRSVCFGDSTHFIDASGINSGSVASWHWTFGDGDTVTEGQSDEQNPVYLYNSAGVFNVCLTVIADNGSVDKICRMVPVNPMPIADFSYSAQHCIGDTVCFTDKTVIENSNIVQWIWNFGDDTRTNIQNPCKYYRVPSQKDTPYGVRLIVVSEHGCIDTAQYPLEIYQVPETFFYSDKREDCQHAEIEFIDTSKISDGSIVSWLWQFGDGSQSVQPSPVKHTFATEGIFDVSLTVTSNNGCKRTLAVENMINIYPAPFADFSFDPFDATILNSTITFMDKSIGANYWTWDFGDGDTLNNQNPKHTYREVGTYTVTQEVYNIYGCKDDYELVVSISPSYQVNVPNAFSPNNDGYNDSFFPKGLGIEDDNFELIIIDRWGQKIYETTELSKPWDGTFMETGKLVQMGVYVWTMNVKDYNGNVHSYKGQVTVVR